jgi:pyruvate dehydrogenase E2 component (dihydrolipoamide acetyltransferase)
MPTVIMPKMGDAMEEGTLLKWLKNEGEEVASGDPIAEIETDKVNLEIEASDTGVMRKHLVTEGQTVPIGQAIAIIGDENEQIEEAVQPAAAAPTAPPRESAPQAASGSAPTDGATAQPAVAIAAVQNNQIQVQDQVLERAPGERVRASPLVRRLAAEHGIDLSRVRGSGPGGRIIKVDITPLIGQPQPAPAAEPAPQAAPAPAAPAAQPEAAPALAAAAAGMPEFEARDLSRIRRTIARRMSESFQQAPHIFITMKIDMGKALELREQINAQVDDQQKVSVNDLILKATALALRKFPMLNASFAGEQVRVYKRIDVGFAIALEGGLISPFIPDADNKPLGQLAAMTKDLVRKAREGGLKPEEYQGGTFTVSNLGMYGVDEFQAVINPPQAAILAVGTISKEPIFRDGQFKPADVMKLTVSADHRVTDGAEVARYLQELKRLLETPMLLLVS